MKNRPVNIVFAGLGGSGVVTASDICAHAALFSGFDVKQSALKGIAQRGGHVISHIRFGQRVYSPRVEPRNADILVSIGDTVKGFLSPGGVLIEIKDREIAEFGRSANIYALGVLSRHLPFPKTQWLKALKGRFGKDALEKNINIFLRGREDSSLK